jgi:hypothetical protein
LSKKSDVSVEGIVAARNNQPYVVLFIGGARAQLAIADARKIAADIVQMASRTEADAMILKFFDRNEFPTGAAAAIMKDFRDFRLALDEETVEGFHSEPTGGHGVQ